MNKIKVLLGLLIVIIISVAASRPPEEGFKNLKVLPKKISHDELVKIMREFNDALGVKCTYCHAKPDGAEHPDFASDAKPEKAVARKMIAMANKINKKFFKASAKYGEENAVLEIRCMTCHHGSAHPENMPAAAPEGEKH